MGTVDICIGNNLIIDLDIFSLWVDGFTIDQCKTDILKKDPSARACKESIIIKDIIDNYHNFNRLEQYLQIPCRLREQLMFQVSEEMIEKLVERYYQYDPFVIREILNHKLTHKQRKDLDDIAEKTETRVRSCRRQFDNLRQIIRILDDLKGPIFRNIIENFCLPKALADDYTAIVFLARNQFDMSKRKLGYLVLDDFIYCANQMINNWSMSNTFENDTDFSRDFLLSFKELKILSEKEFIDEHKRLVLHGIAKVLNNNLTKDCRCLIIFEEMFKDLSRSLIDIAYSLNHSKDMKDLFFDLVERIIEPCKEAKVIKNEITIFLDEYRKKAHFVPDISKEYPKFSITFDKYILTISNCIIQMYH
ncbi:Acidic fibroblast growth factor intracellular-binding [Brachionus plicatilis]|uniref:Acidic fibroblast growth factor intracellular-binding n=1 Tax=Brachionus plicatilis TaxID=10195 RepID=A0A3M7SMR5_BRAPC|nr:Acidic fibroblast growth factor intracellular-binding [Brachionus plicatilis]